ncbi:BrxE family protein [Thiorhodovibrio frisius]|uniref:BrxE family protein n=1 Tax=Thiorhodovibrio frisius TaxID=631362 RepID=H8Z2J9_9GAMM|nr:BrxE family protein [Thiorhodovibrio frisius]EIC22692.1 hypothetical protein Thi970DRAFT_02970 [Thiorhodovibrio frisius]WPL22448.1 hypothetical protein Thiofri_02612 [Thiorhodovibrio frisius]
MTRSLPSAIAELRLLVGFLGEKSQHDWWPSSFLATTSDAFLQPVFPRTTLLAQYHGLCEAARIVHDERVGIGRHYHLYRLPEGLEQSMAQAVSAPEFAASVKPRLTSTESTLARLAELAETTNEPAEGPVLVGAFDTDQLNPLMQRCAGHYQAAYTKGYQRFPYLKAN